MSKDRWMDKHVVYMYNEILFSLQKQKILTYATIWMNLEDIMLKEISCPQNIKHPRFPLTGDTWISQIHRDRKLKCGCQGLGGGETGSYCITSVEFLCRKMKKF